MTPLTERSPARPGKQSQATEPSGATTGAEPIRAGVHRRLRHYEDNGLAAYITHAKYTRFRPDLGRRETYPEAVARVAAMHRTFFRAKLGRRLATDVGQTPADPADHAQLRAELAGASVEELLARVFAAVTTKRVLPSMRSLQFGGEAILRNHARLFNCAFSPADRIAFFREYFFLLLAGVGCGFSVQRQHVARLPLLPARLPRADVPVRTHTVADTIEGWADALHLLLASRFEGGSVDFDFSAIRPRGRPLVTSGGFAPGPLPLRLALSDVATVLDQAAGRRLRPIEIYDICMFLSRAVLSGGTRRSASLCLFSPDDTEMMNAKTGSWLGRQPQRAACNNSAVLSRSEGQEALFRRLFDAQKKFGEPAFYFSDHPDYGCNPCCETGLHPVLPATLGAPVAARLRALGYAGELPPGAPLSGWQMCNLTTINGAALHTAEDFFLACLHAAVIGTLQAAYTDTGYLGPVTRLLNERDALLGVSICGFMDNPGILLAPRILERGARLCRAANQLVAAVLGISPAARVTCVKPEGTASLLLGAAPGIHPHHARHYFRRVVANRGDPVYQHFRACNPQMTETSVLRPATDDVVTFPVAAPSHAILRDDVGAVEFLARVRLVQQHWVLPGEAPATASPGLHHNVSHTCTVRPDEWNSVADFIWQHRADFTGVALLAHDGGQHYPQRPLEEVSTDQDAIRWNQLECHPVEYMAMSEASETPVEPDPCAAGVCDVP
jgi:ribonucleoside-triphosphate reductase